jgi:putative lipase involved disintegration of autophagic bodies
LSFTHTSKCSLEVHVNKNNVFLHAKDLLVPLKRERPEAQLIIFVAHSLGGILVKEVLRRSNELTQVLAYLTTVCLNTTITE